MLRFILMANGGTEKIVWKLNLFKQKGYITQNL
jgi:hypothetical protein